MPFLTTLALMLAVAPTSGQAQATPPQANQGARPSMEQITVHGGMGFIAKEHAFEVVLMKDAAHVYVYNMKAEPVGASGLSGNLVLKPKGGAEKNFELKPVLNVQAAREYLKGAQDIASLIKDSLPTSISIKGLAGATEKEVSFDLTFKGLSPIVRYVCTKCSVEAVDPGQCTKCKGALQKTVKEADGKVHTQG